MFHGGMHLGVVWRGAQLLLRMVLGGVFIWAGLQKLQQPYEFLGDVYNYELVGPQEGLWIAVALPWLEVSVGASMVAGVWCGGGALVAVALSCVFVCAESSAVAQGLKIPCGCAIGDAPEYTSWWKVAEAGLMVLAASGVLVGSFTRVSLNDRPSQQATA
jgi:putative oxidoreductase